MKLRIRGNSIRLRLTKSEVTTLGEGGRVAETVIFAPSKTFTYAIEAADIESMQAEYANDVMLIRVSRAWSYDWANSELIGMSIETPISENAKLAVIVEKDFACLSPRGEEDADTFEHPLTGQTTC